MKNINEFKTNIRRLTDDEWSLVIKYYQETTYQNPDNWTNEDEENLNGYRENALCLDNYCEDGPGYSGPIFFFIGGYLNYLITWILVVPERDGEAYLERIESDIIL